MLSMVPTIAAVHDNNSDKLDYDRNFDDNDDNDRNDNDDGDINEEGVDVHFDAINAKLTIFENLLKEVSVLFLNQNSSDEGIVLTMLSFM